VSILTKSEAECLRNLKRSVVVCESDLHSYRADGQIVSTVPATSAAASLDVFSSQ